MTDQNKPRLGVLGEPLPDMAALLLQSIAGTHTDVLQFHELDESYQLGIRSVSGTFTHTPSGRRYVIAVCAIPTEA